MTINNYRYKTFFFTRNIAEITKMRKNGNIFIKRKKAQDMPFYAFIAKYAKICPVTFGSKFRKFYELSRNFEFPKNISRKNIQKHIFTCSDNYVFIFFIFYLRDN